MKRVAVYAVLLALALVSAATLAAKDEPRWKALQFKHFTVKPGVSLSKEDVNFVYDELDKRLRKQSDFGAIAGEDTPVPSGDAADTVLLEGEFTKYERGGTFTSPKISVTISLYRLSDHRKIKSIPIEFACAKGTHGGRGLGDCTAFRVAHEIKEARKNLPPLATFPPAAPAEAKAPAPPGPAVQAPSSGETLTNTSIVEMVTAKLPEDVIITKIETSPNHFDLSTPALADLNQKGVPSAVLKAMLKAPKAAPSAPQAAPPAAASTQPTITAPHHDLPFRTAEVKRFTFADGVELTGGKIDQQEYLNLVARELQSTLQKKNVATQVLAEGSAVPETDAADSMVVEGRIAEFRTPHSTFNPGVLALEIRIYRRSDHAMVATVTPTFKFLPPMYKNTQSFAHMTGGWAAEAIQKALK